MNEQNSNGNNLWNGIPNNQNMNNGNNFDPNTGQPLNNGNVVPMQQSMVQPQQNIQQVQNVMPTYNFDPNTGQPIAKPGNSNKKIFIILGVLVGVAVLFCLLFVRVISCESEVEEYGVSMITKVSAVSIFGDIKTMKIEMEIDLSELDEDEQEVYIDMVEETYSADSLAEIKVKKDKIYIEKEGFKKEEVGELDKDGLEDMFDSIDLVCK
ncbi:MAG: hypothetical protein IJ475_03745 [Bacilli bacterium]|nr:hypothetical protein [Bacilli bacterium]